MKKKNFFFKKKKKKKKRKFSQTKYLLMLNFVFIVFILVIGIWDSHI